MKYIPAPNLLPHTRTIERKKQTAIRSWTFALCALTLVVVIPSAMLSIHLRSSEPADTDHVERFANDLVELRASIPSMKKQLAQLESDSRAQQLAQNRIHWPTVLDHLGSITSKLVRIHAFNAQVMSHAEVPYIEFTLQTHTRTLSEAREYLVSLESTGLFDEIEMLDSRKQSGSVDAPVNSTIRTRIKAQVSNMPDSLPNTQTPNNAGVTP